MPTPIQILPVIITSLKCLYKQKHVQSTKQPMAHSLLLKPLSSFVTDADNMAQPQLYFAAQMMAAHKSLHMHKNASRCFLQKVCNIINQPCTTLISPQATASLLQQIQKIQHNQRAEATFINNFETMVLHSQTEQQQPHPNNHTCTCPSATNTCI